MVRKSKTENCAIRRYKPSESNCRLSAPTDTLCLFTVISDPVLVARNAAFPLVTMAMFFKPHARGVPPLLCTPLRLAVDQGFFLMAKIIVLAKCDLAANKSWIEDYMQRENSRAEKEEFFGVAGGFLRGSEWTQSPIILVQRCNQRNCGLQMTNQ